MEEPNKAYLKYRILFEKLEESENALVIGNATLEDIRIENEEIDKLRKIVIDTTEDDLTSYTTT